METDERLAALELSRKQGVGAASFRALLARHGGPAAALAAREGEPGAGRKAPTVEGLGAARRWVEAGGELLYLGGPGYPAALGALSEAPPVLFVAGDAGALGGELVAVVGGREASPRAMEAARQAGRRYAEAGATVVSGGARGVDGAALAGALEAGGRAVAVLGSGIDVVYPPEHERLFWRCQGRGAVVSELLPGAPPMQSFFVTRNRIIAGLARATLLVWGRAGSGALVTARWSRKLGRPVAALDWGDRGDASAQAARQGALALPAGWLTGEDPAPRRASPRPRAAGRRQGQLT